MGSRHRTTHPGCTATGTPGSSPPPAPVGGGGAGGRLGLLLRSLRRAVRFGVSVGEGVSGASGADGATPRPDDSMMAPHLAACCCCYYCWKSTRVVCEEASPRLQGGNGPVTPRAEKALGRDPQQGRLPREIKGRKKGTVSETLVKVGAD